MKQEYRHTKAPELIHLDRPLKKRDKKKPFLILSDGLGGGFTRRNGNPCYSLGRYETRARAEQALPALGRRGWTNCIIVES